MADRFFCLAPSERGRIVLTGDEARHLARVRRLGVGDVVEVFDGRSREAERMAVVEVRRDEVLLESVGEKVADRMGPTGLVVASATPKGERFDWLVEKAVEVGVDRLVPIRSARSVVEPRAGKLDRQRRAIIEASKQCGRNRLMVLGSSMPLADYLAEETAGTRWIAHPGGLGFGSWPVGEGDDRALLIGPEGGLTEEELAAATARGWTPVSLGPTILRIETATIVGAALALAVSARRG